MANTPGDLFPIRHSRPTRLRKMTTKPTNNSLLKNFDSGQYCLNGKGLGRTSFRSCPGSDMISKTKLLVCLDSWNEKLEVLSVGIQQIKWSRDQ
mmetsp:Transcript_15879/g.36615  ORF Transcript_15879/g.36615 Transcript_15879/m.36615 type:complete len:94 (-) Transcript_15879:256-537(-)